MLVLSTFCTLEPVSVASYMQSRPKHTKFLFEIQKCVCLERIHIAYQYSNLNGRLAGWIVGWMNWMNTLILVWIDRFHWIAHAFNISLSSMHKIPISDSRNYFEYCSTLLLIVKSIHCAMIRNRERTLLYSRVCN